VDSQRVPESGISLGQAIEERLAANEIEDTTRRTYVGYIERTIKPAIGALPPGRSSVRGCPTRSMTGGARTGRCWSWAAMTMRAGHSAGRRGAAPGAVRSGGGRATGPLRLELPSGAGGPRIGAQPLTAPGHAQRRACRRSNPRPGTSTPATGLV
jgi:hypothetical protein